MRSLVICSFSSYEETGIISEDISVGPRVWHSEIELVLKGVRTLFDETFVVVKTKRNDIALCAPTEDEKQVVKELRWFSLDDIKQSKDPIFPEALTHYLPDVLAEKYPKAPINIDLRVGVKNE